VVGPFVLFGLLAVRGIEKVSRHLKARRANNRITPDTALKS
jgi:hypothetical protein